MTPSIGRIVHYRLSEYDVAQIDERHPSIVAGRQVRNSVSAGIVYPALIVQAFGLAVNLRVFLDGAGEYWATSRQEAPDDMSEGYWFWPPRV